MAFRLPRLAAQWQSLYCLNRRALVLFSGGKDSVVVSELVRKALGKSSILHLMTDTTIEAKDTYKYIKKFQCANPQIPFIIVKPLVDFQEISSKIGPPSRILRWCCSSHKTAPMSVVVNILRSKKSNVLSFDGIRSSESSRRNKYSRITYKHKIPGEVLASPIQKWRDIDVWAFILSKGVEFNRGYRYGFRRMGCLTCPFNSHWSEFLIAIRYGKELQKWQHFLIKHAKKIGHPNPDIFAEKGWRTRVGGRGMNHLLASIKKTENKQEENTFTYFLARPWSDTFFEFIKPFGDVEIVNIDGFILRADLVEHKTKTLLATLNINKSHNEINITYYKTKNLRLFIQRVERQVKKYQSCVMCGSCSMYCKEGAININGGFLIDSEKCNHCLSCVRAPCIAVESLTPKGPLSDWRDYNGVN